MVDSPNSLIINHSISLESWLKDNKMFLLQDSRVCSYADAAKTISKLSGYLYNKLKDQNEVVPMVIGNSIEFIITLFALMGAGKIPYPIQPKCTKEELLRKLTGLNNVSIVAISDECERLSDEYTNLLNIDNILSNIDNTDSNPILTIPASSKFICGTSGTTAIPKKVLMQLDRVLRNAKSHANSLNLTKDDIIFSCLPFYHGFTLLTHIFSVISLHATFAIGNSTYPPDISDAISKHNVTYTSFVPAIADVIVKNYQYDNFNKPSLKKVSVGSAPASVSQLKKYFDYFFKQDLFLTYGQTEAGPRITTLKIDDKDEKKLSSVGKII